MNKIFFVTLFSASMTGATFAAFMNQPSWAILATCMAGNALGLYHFMKA